MMMNRHAPAKLEGEEIITNAEKPVSSRSGSNLEIWFAKKRQLVDSKKSDVQTQQSFKSLGIRSKLTVDSIQSSNYSLSKSGGTSSYGIGIVKRNPQEKNENKKTGNGLIFQISEKKVEEDAESTCNKENNTKENEEELSYISKG